MKGASRIIDALAFFLKNHPEKAVQPEPCQRFRFSST